MIKSITTLVYRWRIILHDIVVIPIAWLGSYWFRFNLGQIPQEYWDQGLRTLPFLCMVDRRKKLHREIFDGDELAGGLYGIGIGRAFFGESMFSAQPNASKFALLYLDHLMDSDALGIVDCQVQSSHLLALGARMIPRSDFVALLGTLCSPPERLDFGPDGPISVSGLVQ